MRGPEEDASEDCVTEIEFELTDPGYFFIGLASDEGCRVRSDASLRLSTGESIEFFTAFDCRFQAIRDRAMDVPSIDTCRVLAERGDEVVFRIDRTGRSIRECLEGVGAIPTSIRATDGEGRVLAEVPAGADARTVIGTFL
ncbi:MAG: bacterio-opsin activator domain-containing protein, partial [Halobacteriales archaeon]|nr:bacterio-opsin activator domain-containing protein [Halobacteriales archaeon]